MTYLVIGALILLVALISVSDLIYRRFIKRTRRGTLAGSPRRRRFALRPGRDRDAYTLDGASSRPSASVKAPPGGTEFVRVKLRSGRIVEGWREATPSKDGPENLSDAFDLDVSSAFDPNGNPMSFPSDSFIVFTSQVERLDVLEVSPEAKPKREVPAERERALGGITAPIAPVPQEAGPKGVVREEPQPPTEAEKGSETPEDESSEGLGRVIPLPEPEVTAPAAVLAPAPEPAPQSRQWRPVEAPPPPSAEPSRQAPVPTVQKKRRSRPFVWVGAIAVLLVIALVVDGLFTFLSLSHALESARSDLRRGASALLAGHYQSARAEFLKAATASGDADGLQGHPSFWVVSHLPRVNRDATALGALGRSSDLASQAGLDAVQAIRAMGAPAEGLAAAIYSQGQINLNASQRGEPFFVDIESKLGQAYTTLRRAPQPVFGAVQTALSLALAKVAEAKDAIHKTRSLIQALPSLFGRDQPRHYLLLFDNPSIARGSGGPITFFGILTARAGSLSVGTIRPVVDLPPVTVPQTVAPVWFRKAYGAQGAFDEWDEVGLSPSFDAVAPVAESRYERATGSVVDGVIQMDPVALGLLTKAVGALRQPGYDVSVTSDNAVRVLTHDAYLHFVTDRRARDLWVAGLIEQVWTRVARGDASAAELKTALGDASRGSHFTMYSDSQADERALNQVGVGATFSTFEPNVQMAATNNTSVSRLGYYERRASSTSVRLTLKGQAYVTTTFQLTDSAPKTPSRVLVRNPRAGNDHTSLSFILPLHANVQGLSLAGKPHDYDLGPEGANPRLTLPLIVPPGHTVRVVCRYVVPHAVTLGSNGGVFNFTILPQAAANPDATSVRVIPPEGLEIVPGGSVGGVVQDSSYVATDTAGGPLTLEVKLAPPP